MVHKLYDSVFKTDYSAPILMDASDGERPKTLKSCMNRMEA